MNLLKGEIEMFKKKIGLILILATLGISTIVFVFANKNDDQKHNKIAKDMEKKNQMKI